MTQKEFDKMMASLNEAQALEQNPIMDNPKDSMEEDDAKDGIGGYAEHFDPA